MVRKSKSSQSGGKRRRGKDNVTVTWNDIDPGTIVEFIDLVERLDGAIRFGRSRDGCVYSIGFYIGEERFTEWVRGSDDVDMEFSRLYSEIAEDFDAETDLPDDTI